MNLLMNHEKSYSIIQRETQSLQDLMLSKAYSIIELSNKYNDSYKNSVNNFIDSTCSSYSINKKQIFQQHDINNEIRFNFFESISDKWYRENFHSDILYTILNPKTKEIGRKYFLQEFVDFLGLSKNQFDCTQSFEVTKEHPTGKILWTDNNGLSREKEGYIDLLIKNKSQAIIIENKINYAPDMENQLVRYMKYVEQELKISTYTVVYLTLIDDRNKKPPLSEYDTDFSYYTNKLNNKKLGILKEIYAVNDIKSLSKDFLPNCCKRITQELTQNTYAADSCTLAKIYIEQYQILLNHLGGKAYMMSTYKKLIEEIYASKEKFDAATDFADFWNNHRTDTLNEIILEKLQKKYPNTVLEMEKIHGAQVFLFSTDSKAYYVYWDGDKEIGFASLHEKKFTQKQINELFKIIHNTPNKTYEKQNDEWVYCGIKDSQSFLTDILDSLNNFIETKI